MGRREKGRHWCGLLEGGQDGSKRERGRERGRERERERGSQTHSKVKIQGQCDVRRWQSQKKAQKRIRTTRPTPPLASPASSPGTHTRFRAQAGGKAARSSGAAQRRGRGRAERRNCSSDNATPDGLKGSGRVGFAGCRWSRPAAGARARAAYPGLCIALALGLSVAMAAAARVLVALSGRDRTRAGGGRRATLSLAVEGGHWAARSGTAGGRASRGASRSGRAGSGGGGEGGGRRRAGGTVWVNCWQAEAKAHREREGAEVRLLRSQLFESDRARGAFASAAPLRAGGVARGRGCPGAARACVGTAARARRRRGEGEAGLWRGAHRRPFSSV